MNKQNYNILVINPGSTSTKLALFNNKDLVFEIIIEHSSEDLNSFATVLAQYEMRSKIINQVLENHNVELNSLSCIVGRGGPLKPLSGGVYEVDNSFYHDLKAGGVADHASNLGGIIARHLADQAGIPAYIADPVCVDEFEALARISGIPELSRISLAHALNCKAVGREYAESIGKHYEDLNLIICHLGGGITIGAHKQGRQIDVNNANDGGPFSPERCGTVPITGLMKMCYRSGLSESEMKKKLIGNSGLSGHCGTNDAREIEDRINSGDDKAKLIYEAMAYGIAKEIGAMATVLNGKVDAIVFTGRLANSKMLINWITERISFIAPTACFPGGREMEALAQHGLDALTGKAVIKKYS